MQSILLVLHILITVALIGIILLQRSESDGLGIGGGGNQLFTGRSKANILTRTTALLATLFILNSIALSMIAARRAPATIMDHLQEAPAAAPSAETPVQETPATPPAAPVAD